MSATGSVEFFFDNNLSPKLAAGMKEFGELVVHLQDLFDADVEDVVLLEHVGKKGYVLVSRDLAIRKRPAELGALKANSVGAFFLGGKNRGRCELIQQLVRNWPRMKQLAQTKKRPFAFRIPPQGTKIDPIPL